MLVAGLCAGCQRGKGDLTGARVAELTAAFEIYADQAWAQQTALRLGYTPDVPREMAPTR